jgi:hypothetical protein
VEAGDDRESLFLTAVSLEGATCGRPKGVCAAAVSLT